MKNSIEEDIEIIESIIEEYENCSVPEVDMQVNVTFREKQNNALNHILSDYKRVLKENEELKNKKEKTIKKIGQFSKKAETLPYDYDYINGVSDVIKIVEENL